MFGIDPKRIRGLIQGCALGDAFGMPTEMLSQEFIRENIGDIKELKASFDFSVISKNRPAGSITDDTMNTLMMMEMIKESNGIVNVNLYLDKLMEWSVNSPIAEFVTGPSTHRAMEAIKSGVSLEETGKMGTTNGAAMKIAPLGIVCDYQDLPTLVETVADICKPTHNTSIAIQGASVIAAIASYILREGNDWEEIWQIASKTANLASKYGNQLPTASIEHRMKLAKEIVDSSPVEVAMQRLYLEVGTGLETIELVPSALAIAYLSKGNPLTSAQISATIGGDTDTLGAVSTSLCGALNPHRIPTSHLKLIEEVNGIDLSM